jgi:polar amino acid transport system substrate-binding protein
MFENCADGSLDRARQKGITLGESAIAPHSILDPNTKKASGIDVEINNAVLDWLGVEKRTIEWIPWESQIPSLLSKRTDVIAQNIHVNPERVKVISFTGPAWWYGPVVLVQKGNPDDIKSYGDFKGEAVGAVSGSAAENYLRRIGANTQPFKAPAEELQSLDQGRVKSVVEDDVIYTVFAKRIPTPTSRRSGASRRLPTSSTAAATAMPATASARRTASCGSPTRRHSPSCARTAS